MTHRKGCRYRSLLPGKKSILILFIVMAVMSLNGCTKQQAGAIEDADTQISEDASPWAEAPAEAEFSDGVSVGEGARSEASQGEANLPDAVREDTSADRTLDHEPQTATLIMVGDILLHDPIEEAARRDDGSYDFNAVFANTADIISRADVALVNQEVIIGGEELGVSGYPAFNAPYAIGDALYNAGFDVVLHATNHALDRGANGIDNCLSYWEETHPDMAVLGIYEDAEDRSDIYIRRVNGIRIAILNYTYGTNGIDLPAGQPYAVNLMDEAHRDQIADDLAAARKEADIVIVCPHWGIEYELEPSPSQREWTAFFAANGADIIIGTHPHVIEPIEMVYDEVEGDETLCYYSLGNFVNWTSDTGTSVADRMVGGMAEVTIEKTDEGVSISDFGVRALVTHLSDGQDGVTVYPLSDYSEDISYNNRIREQDPSFSYEYCTDLCDRVWKDRWE